MILHEILNLWDINNLFNRFIKYLEQQVKQVAQHVWWSVEQQESQLDQLMSQLKED